MTSACSGRLLAETESAAALVEVIERVQLTAEGFRIVLKISVPCGPTALPIAPQNLGRTRARSGYFQTNLR